MIISQLLALLSLTLWLLAAGFAVLAFDAGFSWRAVLIAGAVWAYPFLVLLCAASAWVAFGKGNAPRAAVLTALPLGPPLVYLAWLFLAPI